MAMDHSEERGRGGRSSRGGDRRRRGPRRKVCRFCEDGTLYIDYKNYRRLRDYVSERGKIVARRITGTCAKHQRMLTRAIKLSREIALLAFTHK